MTPGVVVTLRVNPKDAMSVVDVLQQLGIPTDNLSFNQATKIVLASFLSAARQNNSIPDRAGFEYNEMLAPFRQQTFASRGAKLRTANMLARPQAETNIVVTPEQLARKVRFDELMFKRTADPINFSDDEMSELAPLLEEFQA